MANYYAKTRTNYFRVKDAEKFKEYMNTRIGVNEDKIELWEKVMPDGTKLYGFGCYGNILGEKVNQESEDIEELEYDYDDFCNSLAEFVADDDAIIITEIGNEKLRYLTGYSTIITSKEITCLSLSQMAAHKAAEVLKNPSWQTQMEY